MQNEKKKWCVNMWCFWQFAQIDNILSVKIIYKSPKTGCWIIRNFHEQLHTWIISSILLVSWIQLGLSKPNEILLFKRQSIEKKTFSLWKYRKNYERKKRKTKCFKREKKNKPSISNKSTWDSISCDTFNKFNRLRILSIHITLKCKRISSFI